MPALLISSCAGRLEQTLPWSDTDGSCHVLALSQTDRSRRKHGRFRLCFVGVAHTSTYSNNAYVVRVPYQLVSVQTLSDYHGLLLA